MAVLPSDAVPSPKSHRMTMEGGAFSTAAEKPSSCPRFPAGRGCHGKDRRPGRGRCGGKKAAESTFSGLESPARPFSPGKKVLCQNPGPSGSFRRSLPRLFVRGRNFFEIGRDASLHAQERPEPGTEFPRKISLR